MYYYKMLRRCTTFLLTTLDTFNFRSVLISGSAIKKPIHCRFYMENFHLLPTIFYQFLPEHVFLEKKKKKKNMQSTYYKLNSHILLICVTRTLTWWGCKSDIVYLTLVLPYHIFVTIKSGVKALQLNDFKDLIRKGVWGNTKEDG